MKIVRALSLFTIAALIAGSSSIAQIVSRPFASYAATSGAIATTLSTTNATFYMTFAPANSSSNQALSVSTPLTYNPSTQSLGATNFVGALTGNATTATAAATAAVTNDDSTSGDFYPVWVTANTGNRTLRVTSTKLSYNPTAGVFTNIGVGTFTSATTSTSSVLVKGGSSVGTPDGNAAQILLGPIAAARTSIAYDYAGGGDLYLDNTFDSATGDIFLRTRTAGTPVVGMKLSGLGVITVTAPPGASAGDIPACISTGNDLHTAAVTCGTSRLDAKKNVKSLSEYLSEKGTTCSDYLAVMQPVKFDWRYDDHADIGFIADWMTEIDPLLATYEGKRLTNVKDRAILAVTTCALQEEARERQSLEKRLAALEGRSVRAASAVIEHQ